MHPSRHAFFQKMIGIFGNGVVPVCIPVNLETDESNKPDYVPLDKDIASVFVFDAKQQALSLLQVMGIMLDINNLVVDVQKYLANTKLLTAALVR